MRGDPQYKRKMYRGWLVLTVLAIVGVEPAHADEPQPVEPPPEVAPPEVPPPVDPVDSVEKPPGETPPVTSPPPTPAEALAQTAQHAAQQGDCGTVKVISGHLRALDSRYHASVFAPDGEIAVACPKLAVRRDGTAQPSEPLPLDP